MYLPCGSKFVVFVVAVAKTSLAAMQASSGFMSLFVYACYATCLIGSLVYDEVFVPAHHTKLRFGGFGGKWKYLTHLNMVSMYHYHFSLPNCQSTVTVIALM